MLQRLSRFVMHAAIRRNAVRRFAERHGMKLISGVMVVWFVGLFLALYFIQPAHNDFLMREEMRQVESQAGPVLSAMVRERLWEELQLRKLSDRLVLRAADAQPQPLGTPVVFSVVQTLITPSGSGIQKYAVTPTGALVSATSEVFCAPALSGTGGQPALAATDNVLPPYISATTAVAGSPPNYIVLQISSTASILWRCVVMQHPF